MPIDMQDAIDNLLILPIEQAKKADAIIANELVTSGFTKLWLIHEEMNQELYNLYLLTEMMDIDFTSRRAEIVEDLNLIIGSLTLTIEFQKKNLNACTNNFSYRQLATHDVLIKMYSEFIDSLARALRNCLFIKETFEKISSILNMRWRPD